MKIHNILLTAITALASGAALIIAKDTISANGVVVVAAIIFIIAGIINAFIFSTDHKKNNMADTFSIFTSIGAAILGICMIIFKPTFISLVPYIFGIIILVAALCQIYITSRGAKPASMPAWLYIPAIILIGISIYVILQSPIKHDQNIMLATGIALCLYGLAALADAALIKPTRKKAGLDQTPHHDTEQEPHTTSQPPIPLDEYNSQISHTNDSSNNQSSYNDD